MIARNNNINGCNAVKKAVTKQKSSKKDWTKEYLLWDNAKEDNNSI